MLIATLVALVDGIIIYVLTGRRAFLHFILLVLWCIPLCKFQ